MKRKYIGRILGVLGLLLAFSALFTWLIGATFLASFKIFVALCFFSAFGITHFGELGSATASRGAFFYGVNAVASIVVLALLGTINYIAVKQDARWDVTGEQVHQLSPDTERTLAALGEDVEVLAFVKASEPAYPHFRDLFERYARLSEHFRYEFVDPAADPERAAQYAIREGGARVVLRRGALESRVHVPSEEALTHALVQVTRTEVARIALTTGHGEASPSDQGPGGLSQIARRMENEGMRVETLNLAAETSVPEDLDAVVIAGSKVAFTEHELGWLHFYLFTGGKVLILLDPLDDDSLGGLLRQFDLIPERNMLVDAERHLRSAGETALVVNDYSPASDITRQFALNTVFPTARPLTVVKDTGSNLDIEPLAITGPGVQAKPVGEAKAEERATPAAGPFVLAASVVGRLPEEDVLPEREFRLVVVGDRDFATNAFQSVYGNEDFFLNSLNWISGKTDRITLRPRQRTASRLFLTPVELSLMTFLLLDLLPLLLLGTGLTVWMVRRSK